MKHRSPLSLLLCLPLGALAIAGCMQPWDSSAADGVKNAPEPPPPDFHSRVIMTPPIEEGPGTGVTTSSACEATRFQVLNDNEDAGPLGILVQECSGCHGETGTSGPNFNFVLDIPKLLDPATEGQGICNHRRFIVPGDTNNSCIFERMLNAAMPPTTPGLAEHVEPRPRNVPATISEASIMMEWITNCLGATAASPEPPTTPTGTGGSSGGGSGTGGASGTPDNGTGGMTGAAGATGAGGRGGRTGRGGAGGA